MLTERSSRVGAAEEVVLAVLKEKGGKPEVDRPGAVGLEGGGSPGKLVFRLKRASKSVFFGPVLVRRSMVAGRKIFSEREGGESVSREEGRRSVE